MSEQGITGATLNACLQEYWYLWTIVAIGMIVITIIDAIIAYFFLRNSTSKVEPTFSDYVNSTQIPPAPTYRPVTNNNFILTNRGPKVADINTPMILE